MLWLKDIEGSIDFWNQPQFSGAECTFDYLVECVVEKYDSGNYDGIVAHSFGCDLALNALSRVRNPVNELILISPIRDLSESFLAFGEMLIGAAKCSELRRMIEIREANRSAISPEEVAAFWGVVGGIVADPQFYTRYWGTSQKLLEFESVSSKLTPLNFNMWQSILNDFFNHASSGLSVNCKKTVILGNKDPYYLKVEDESAYWQKQGFISRVMDNCGHHPHLESSALRNLVV